MAKQNGEFLMKLERIKYYFNATYRRKILDKLLEKNKSNFEGIILDIGGRDRGRFKKPKSQVEKWIFADIVQENNPDIVLDVCDMHSIQDQSIDTILAAELFEHVDNPKKGLKECYRVLKKQGKLIISVPFLYPIHADPDDFQRWTEDKWQKELKEIGFNIEKLNIMGRYFSVSGDFIKIFIRSIFGKVRYLFFIIYPLIDLWTKFDRLNYIKKSKLGKFHSGYFIIVNKSYE